MSGKVVLVTGAAQGQGRAHAVVCASEGADIILLDIAKQIPTALSSMGTPGGLAETARLVEDHDQRALVIEADVRSQRELDEAVAAGIAEFGHIDALCANAGISSLAPFWEMTEEQWDDLIGVNLTGVWKSAKAVAPHMIERKTGSMVFTSSVNALEPAPGLSHYTSAKHGLLGLMKSVALEMAPYNVRCNSVGPGAIDTAMVDNQRAYDWFAGHEGGTREDAVRGGRHYHALKGRSLMAPEVVAKAAMFLNSELAEAVTGVNLPVDAGHSLLTGFNHAPTL